MDYSKFYHDWLQLDLAPEELPNFYQILGVRNMEPDVQKIETAFLNTLDRLQCVNGMTNPEAYTAIMSRVLEARKVFNDPNQKHTYDLQLSQNTGERVWKGYERPSFLTRVCQMSLIAFSFILGLGVVVVMAFSVERNPDGSIIFREEAQARKAPPFASQLDYVVYRPSIAQDYQPNGYTVTGNKAAHKTEPAPAEVASETSEPKAEEQDVELSDSSAVAENQSTQSEMEEFSQILSEKIATPNRQRVTKVNRRSPLYNKTMAFNEEASESPNDLNSGESKPESDLADNADQEDLSIEVVEDDSRKGELETPSEIPAEMPAEGLPQVASEIQETVFSLTSVIELLENVRSNMDFSKPNAEEAYVLLQYQTIHEILQKISEANGALKSEEVEKFAEYTRDVMTKLSRKKHFDEAYQLCDMMKEFSEKRDLANVDNMIAQHRIVIQNYQKVYITSQEVLKKLQDNPDDPLLNSRYAAWLWQDTGDIEGSIPYLVKCQNEDLRKVAKLEMDLRQSTDSDDQNAEILQVADNWWQIADSLSLKYIPMVKEHAKKLYRKVDSNYLNDTQKARLASL